MNLRASISQLLPLLILILLLGWNATVFEIDPYGEFFHIEAAKEMAASGRFWIPQVHGYDYLLRSPLWTWIVWLFFKVFGIGLWAARLPAVIFAIGTLALTFLLSLELSKSRPVAAASALVLMSMWGFFHQATLSTADIASSCLLLGFLLMVVRWQPLASRRQSRPEDMHVYSKVFGVFLGVALLLKGSMLAVLMAVLAWLYLWRTHNLNALENLYWKPVAGFAALIALPWPILVAAIKQDPSFPWRYFAEYPVQQWLGSGPWSELQHDFTFYLRRIGINLLPYPLFLLAFALDMQFRERLKANTDDWLGWLPLWFAVGFVFWSTSAFQEPTLMLPFYPALAILTGFYVGRTLETVDTGRVFNTLIGLHVVLLMALAMLLTLFVFQVLPVDYVAGFWQLPGLALLDTLNLGITEIELGDPVPLWKLWLVPAPFILIAGGALLYWTLVNRRVHMGGFVMIVSAIAFLLFLKLAFLPILERPVAERFARYLNETTTDADRIVMHSRHPDLKRVMFYLTPERTRQVMIVSAPETMGTAITAPDEDAADETGTRTVYGVSNESGYYALPFAFRRDLRLSDANWKWNVDRLPELSKLLLLRQPHFDTMKSHLILFQTLPAGASEASETSK